jgi:hypothetical protein
MSSADLKTLAKAVVTILVVMAVVNRQPQLRAWVMGKPS